MKNHPLVFAIFGLAGALACAAPAAAKPRLFFDQAHGEGAPTMALATVAKQAGLSIALAPGGPITPDDLQGVTVLCLRAPSRAFAPEEKEAVVTFVQEGGSLLLVLDEEKRQSLTKTGVNDLIRPFGMSLTPDTPYLHNCGALAKAGEVNRADRELPFSGGRAVEGGTAFAWQLDKDGNLGKPFAAFKELGQGGRIVVMGEGMASLLLGKAGGQRLSGEPHDPANTVYWGKDSAVFMREVLEWLSGGGSGKP